MGKLSLTGGENKRRKLKIPKGIRPTRAIVKRSIFDTLRDFVVDCDVLEIFAGSGAVGFEALSRGARFCVFIEKSREGTLTIIENAKKLGVLDKIKVIKADFTKGLNDLLREQRQFDFIFADPPYDFVSHEELFKRVAPLLKTGGLYLVEVRNKTLLPESWENLSKVKEVNFGQTKVVYYRMLSGDL
ncbi:MAG: 16S rRNA (guanine(966)-N(2))-methyltransferase RsmD [bacterium]|nr:16S rRNA (guanine(966)-N(2))-methyltransferase RsmD [bacterium]